jgi:hypothetical protein
MELWYYIRVLEYNDKYKGKAIASPHMESKEDERGSGRAFLKKQLPRTPQSMV